MYSYVNSNEKWFYMQLVMEQVFDCGGGNKYKLLYILNKKLRREGRLLETKQLSNWQKQRPLENSIL